MYVLISAIILIACVFLVLVVLVQNSKGGGLASNFAGSNQVMGVRKTADFLEKATWILAASLMALSVFASWTIEKKEEVEIPRVEINQAESPIKPDNLPELPSGFPEEE